MVKVRLFTLDSHLATRPAGCPVITCYLPESFLSLFQLIGGTSQAYVREVIHTDPRTQTTHISSVNLNLSQYVSVLEHISYTPDPAAPLTRTAFFQSANIQARMPRWKSVEETLERWSLDIYGKNAEKGKSGFEHILRTLWESPQRIGAAAHQVDVD